MPRVHINLHDIDEIEELEQQEDWEELIGLSSGDQRRDGRAAVPEQRKQRGTFRELHFGGSETLDRKRSERRKQIARSARRFGQQRV